MSSGRFIPQLKFETPLTFDRAAIPPPGVPRVAFDWPCDHGPRSARYTEASAVTFSMVRR
jgi:hypothetical protein